MQTFFVNLIALLLTPEQAAVTVGLYILLGAAGLPVFAGGTGGPGMLAGPYCGYIYGFLAAVIVVSLMKGKKPDPFRYGFTAALAGIPIIDFGAVISLMLVGGLDLKGAFLAGVLPFLMGDILKCAAAGAMAAAVEKALRKNGL